MHLSSTRLCLVLFLLPTAYGANCQHYSFALGDINATVLSDGYLELMPNGIAVNVEQEEWEAVLSENFLPKKFIRHYYNPLHLDFGDRKVMVEVGSGDKFGPGSGHLLRNMAAAGLDPLEVTDLLITHRHSDHIGGALLPDGGLAFPNAKVHLSRVEHDFWMYEGADFFPPASALSERAQLLLSVGKVALEAVLDRLVLFEIGDEVIPGVTTRGAGGHTPGQVNYIIKSGDQTLLHAADVLVWDVFSIQHPDWQVGFDLDRPAGVAARYALLEELAQTGVMFLSYHDDFPGLGHIKRRGQGYGLHPVKYRF